MSDFYRQGVQFVYFTGLRSPDFSAATVVGSWNADGYYSDVFAECGMEKFEAADGCLAFRASLYLARPPDNNLYRWGVRLRGASGEIWGIAEEMNDLNSRENVCRFSLDWGGPTQTESYRLNWSRHLGAQKVYPSGGDRPRIQFSVWAPHARSVEVVMGDLRLQGSAVSAIDPQRVPAPGALDSAMEPVRADRVQGGYITDAGEGSHLSWGPFAMRSEGASGVWRTDPDDLAFADYTKFNHCPYMYRVVRDDGSSVFRTDLYSRCQAGSGSIRPADDSPRWQASGLTADLDGLVSCSVIKDPDQVCRDFKEEVYPEQNWVDADQFWVDAAPSSRVPTQVRDLVVYELHVGALGCGKRAPDKPGTLEDAIDFLDYLQALGVNAVELLPMAEIGGGGSGWGYATSHYFAIEYAGGGRDQYKHFIRECHRRGIAVILDVVFNHFNHRAERAEWMYDSAADERNIYYWYEGTPDQYPAFNAAVKPGQVGQGGYLDNLSTAFAPRYWDPMVRRMFVSSLMALVTEFKVDGFRFDQTTSIRAYNWLHADGTSVQSANAFGAKFLREATRALRLVKPEVMLIAEDYGDLDFVTTPADQGGLGFDAAWYADFYHHLIGDTNKGSDYAKLLKVAGFGEGQPLAIDYFAGALEASGQRRVVYHESHDEAGNDENTNRTINVAVNDAPLIGTTRQSAEARVRLVAGITLLSAGTPMFLFGEEVGARLLFLYDKVLQNREDYPRLRQNEGARLFDYYAALIRLRLDPARPAFRSPNVEVVYRHNGDRLLVFRRWEGTQNFLVVASFNDLPFASPSYVIRSFKLGDERWREIFNSDAQSFGGANIGNLSGVRGFAGGIDCVIPANGLVVFERV